VISCSTQLQLYPSVALPTNWDVPVDLFFHRDVEELKKNEDEIAAKLEESQAPAPVAAPVFNEMPPEVDANLVAAATGFNAAPTPEAYGASWEGDAAGAAATGAGDW